MRIGLALAGGGVKGAAHIGAIKALEENGIEIGWIGGTSIGGIVAGLYAMGYQPEEMLKLFKYFAKTIMKVDPRMFVTNVKNTKKLMGTGFLSGENIEVAMEECGKYKNMKNMQDLILPVAIPTVDIKECKKYVFTNQPMEEDYYIKNAPIGKAVRASASYPGMFSPCVYESHKFVDGGLLDNLPTEEVKKMGAEKILSIKFSSASNYDPKNIYEIAMKSIDILFDGRVQDACAISDYLINLDLAKASVFDIKKIDYCYEEGYAKTIEKINEIKKQDRI